MSWVRELFMRALRRPILTGAPEWDQNPTFKCSTCCDLGVIQTPNPDIHANKPMLITPCPAVGCEARREPTPHDERVNVDWKAATERWK